MLRVLFQFANRLSNGVIRFLNLGLVALMVSILADQTLRSPATEWAFRLTVWAILGMLGFVVAVKGVTFCSILLASLSTSVLGKECSHVLVFEGDNGTLSTYVEYYLLNLSTAPQRALITDYEGFACLPPDYGPDYALIDRTVEHEACFHLTGLEAGGPFSQFKDKLTKEICYQGEWAVYVDPALRPLESIRFSRYSTEPTVEARAFSDKGTTFIVRPRLRFLKMHIIVVAPFGYRISNVQSYISDQLGKPCGKLFAHSGFEYIGRQVVRVTVRMTVPYLRYVLAFRLEEL